TVAAGIYECDERRCGDVARDTNGSGYRRKIAPVGLRGGGGTCLPADWVALGYFASLDDRTRHLLDARSPPYSVWGDCSCAPVCLDCPEDYFSRYSGRAQRLGFVLGIPSASRRMGDNLGRDRDDDLGALRRLVAQPLRIGCENRQPSPCGTGTGNVRRRNGSFAVRIFLTKPRERRGPGPQRVDLRTGSRRDDGALGGFCHGVHVAQPPTRVVLL